MPDTPASAPSPPPAIDWAAVAEVLLTRPDAVPADTVIPSEPLIARLAAGCGTDLDRTAAARRLKQDAVARSMTRLDNLLGRAVDAVGGLGQPVPAGAVRVGPTRWRVPLAGEFVPPDPWARHPAGPEMWAVPADTVSEADRRRLPKEAWFVTPDNIAVLLLGPVYLTHTCPSWVTVERLAENADLGRQRRADYLAAETAWKAGEEKRLAALREQERRNRPVTGQHLDEMAGKVAKLEALLAAKS